MYCTVHLKALFGCVTLFLKVNSYKKHIKELGDWASVILYSLFSCIILFKASIWSIVQYILVVQLYCTVMIFFMRSDIGFSSPLFFLILIVNFAWLYTREYWIIHRGLGFFATLSPSLVSKLNRRHTEDWDRERTCCRERVGEETKHTTTRKPGPL